MAVVLHTTAGDLPVLLHYQACPLAAFNFLALCAAGYYDGCRFYRHFPGILLQTGDPTNTGKGGECVFATLSGAAPQPDSAAASSAEATAIIAAGVQSGRYFRDEGFGTTSHARRGVLSMAHKGSKADTNASQFFITTSSQPALDGVYTAFGAVDLNGAYVADAAAVEDAPDSSPEEDAGEGADGVARLSGDAVLRALEAAAAKVDAKNFVQDAEHVRITGATVLYNPFAEGAAKL